MPIEISKISDGDGLTARPLDGSDTDIEVRLFAIDAPELHQKYGGESADHLRKLTESGRFWMMQQDGDRFGRHVAIVYRNGTSPEDTLNFSMVREGWAYWYENYDPNDTLNLCEAMRQAYMEEKGVWVEPNLERPWDYKVRTRAERAKFILQLLSGDDSLLDENRTKIIQAVRDGIDHKAKNSHSQTPLELAISKNLIDVVEALLSNGADVNSEKDDGVGLLKIAVNAGNQEIASLFIEKRADINRTFGSINALLKIASDKEFGKIVAKLIESEASIDGMESYEKLLLRAVRSGREDFATDLLDCTAFPNVRDATKKEILRSAVDSDLRDIEAILRKMGIDYSREEAIHKLKRQGYLDLASALSSAGEGLDVAVLEHGPLLHQSIQGGLDWMVEWLLERGVNADAPNRKGFTPLHFAAQGGHSNIMRKLLSVGADVNATNEDGETLLHFAVKASRSEILKLLLESKADANAPDRRGFTPLHLAAQGGHTNIMGELLSVDADVNVTNEDGETPLHCAVKASRSGIVKLLLESKADANASDGNGFTPLHLAAERGQMGILSELLSADAGIDAINSNGDTPLHLAVRRDQPGVVRNLRARGADLNVTDKDGRTPLELAHKIRGAIAQILEQ